MKSRSLRRDYGIPPTDSFYDGGTAIGTLQQVAATDATTTFIAVLAANTQLDGDRLRPPLPAVPSSDLDDKFAVHTAVLEGCVCAGDFFQVVGVVDDGED